jgi:hypothetical protein
MRANLGLGASPRNGDAVAAERRVVSATFLLHGRSGML